MGELAVGAVDLAPPVEQRHDLGDLPVQQPVQRAAARTAILQLVGGAAAKPPVGPHRAKLQHPAGRTELPAGRHRLLDQVQQAGLGGRLDSGWDPATQPQRPFPSTSSSFQASSLSASPSRAASALACASSRSRSLECVPGRDSANAANAPCLATSRSRMMVERSTSHRSAASPMVVSPRRSCSQISYFCSGGKNRLARRPRRSVPRLESDMIRRSLLGQEPKQMLSDHKPDPYRKLRRKPFVELPRPRQPPKRPSPRRRRPSTPTASRARYEPARARPAAPETPRSSGDRSCQAASQRRYWPIPSVGCAPSLRLLLAASGCRVAFYAAECLSALGELLCDDGPDAAVDALVRRLDSPSLAVLAGLVPAELP